VYAAPLLRRPFGHKIIRELAPLLAKEGTLYWITRRSLISKLRANQTIADLEALGLHPVGCVETGAPPLTLAAALAQLKGESTPHPLEREPQENVELDGVVVIFRRKVPKKRFVGVIYDIETAESAARAFLSVPRKGGRNWYWLDPDNSRTFSDLKESSFLQNLIPRGYVAVQPLRALLHNDTVDKADRPIADTDQAAALLYIPEYEWDDPGHYGQNVSAGPDMPYKARIFYRVSIDPEKANPRFLARLLNGPYGSRLRRNVPRQRRGGSLHVSAASLLEYKLPIPNVATQEQILRIDSDLYLLEAAFREMRTTLDQDWTLVPDIVEKVDRLKAVLDNRLVSGRAFAQRSSPTLPLSLPDAGRCPLFGYAGEPQVYPAEFDCSPVLARRNLFCRAPVPSAAATDRRSLRLFRPLLPAIFLATT
jgi:hypothetical protein